jgi:DNA helicase-2/ATP-dependent DNA helicase PcrA
MKIKAVLFDLDGTLIDTEKYFRICWPMAFHDMGYFLSDEQALYMRSLGRPFVQEFLKENFGEGLDYMKVKEIRKKYMEEYLKDGLALKKGAKEILEGLGRLGIKRGVATASDIERTKRYLGRVGILDCFDHIISATMVEKGKPAPDIYLYACNVMGEDPAECIAIEDAPNGIKSACSAGLKVIMVPDQTMPDENLSKMIFKRADDLFEALKIIEKNFDKQS